MNKRIYLSSPTMHGEEQTYVKDAFDTNWIAPLGPNVNDFEKELSSYLGVESAAALSSGTAALHLSVILAGIKEGDVVLCPDLTFSATVNPVSYERAHQVFVDCCDDSWNMDPEALEKAFEKYPAAKAVIVVNLYGTPSRLAEIYEICSRHGVPLIEDAAESFGATYRGQQTGTFGDFAALSFNGNKIITTSGGGMMLAKDGAMIEKARFLATQARDPAPHYQHSHIGYNYRMSNVVAGIGRGQLLHLNEHIALKEKIYRRYAEAFADIPALSMNPYLPDSHPNFWLSCLQIDPASGVRPEQVMDALAADNIESRPIWKPMHMQPVFANCDYITLKDGVSVSERIFENGLCLPCDIKNSEEDMRRIIDIVRRLF